MVLKSQIKLSEVLQIPNADLFKIHFCKENPDGDGQNPMADFLEGQDKIQKWNEYRGARNRWGNASFIFHLIRLSEKDPETWLFVGIYEIQKSLSTGYRVSLSEQNSNFIGRLVVGGRPNGRLAEQNFPPYYSSLTVKQILDQKYDGEKFEGYDTVNLAFTSLATIFKTQSPSWKAALQNVNGIYLITDRSNGKRYVGKADGTDGIWGRWHSYIQNSHGGNVEFKKLIRENGRHYVAKNFQFSLLEVMPLSIDQTHIEDREGHWKNVLLSRAEKFGYNKN